MNVAHYTFGAVGGAFHAAERLASAQREIGIPAYVRSRVGSDLRGSLAEVPYVGLMAGLDHFAIRNPKWRSQVSLLRDKAGNAREIDASADVHHLHWTSGQIRLEQLSRELTGTSKVVAVTLHDLHLLTGACHLPLGCSKWLADCSECPAVRVAFQERVRANLILKREVLSSFTNLKLFFPSLLDFSEASKIEALSHASLHFVPNPLPADLDNEFFVVGEKKGLALVAQNLDDPNKNIMSTRLTLKKSGHHDISLYGKTSHSEKFGGDHVGSGGTSGAFEVMRKAEFLVLNSLYETAPNVVFEAAALGTPTLVSADSPLVWMNQVHPMVIPVNFEALALPLEEWTMQRRQEMARAVRSSLSRLKIAQNVIDCYSK